MKYFAIFIIFASGYFLGKWQNSEVKLQPSANKEQAALSRSRDLMASDKKLKGNMSGECSQETTKSTVSVDSERSFKKNALESMDKIKLKKRFNDLAKQLEMARENEDLEEQVSLIDQMESLDPKNKKLFEVKSLFFRDQGDYENVRKNLIECIKAHPNFLSCHRQLGNVRTATNEEIDKHTKKCLEISPQEGTCLIDRAYYFFKSQKYPEAIALFEKIIEESLYSNRVREKKFIYFMYAQSLEFNHQYDSAVEIYEKACELKHQKSCKLLNKMFKRTS